jgi:hypothetical protein
MMPRSMTEFYYFDSSWCKENFNVVEPLLSKLTLIQERKETPILSAGVIMMVNNDDNGIMHVHLFVWVIDP